MGNAFASARRTCLAVAITMATAIPAVAHHGWSWTVEELSELKGVIREVYIGNPHATLDVDTDRPPPPLLRASAALSAMLWLGALFAGRFIGFL